MTEGYIMFTQQGEFFIVMILITVDVPAELFLEVSEPEIPNQKWKFTNHDTVLTTKFSIAPQGYFTISSSNENSNEVYGKYTLVGSEIVKEEEKNIKLNVEHRSSY